MSKCDVFSLGVILINMLTGTQAFPNSLDIIDDKVLPNADYVKF